MVTKVVTANDVDNVTIVINGENKLQAKLPATTPSEVVIEEVPNVTPANAVVTLNGIERRIVKLGKVSGTDWLVFQLDSSKPTIIKNIFLGFYDDVGADRDPGGAASGLGFDHTGKIRYTYEDYSPFTFSDSSTYVPFGNFICTLTFDGNTQKGVDNDIGINRSTMTYNENVYYNSPQSSSTLTRASFNGVPGFRVEHEDAIYEYHITGVSVVQNTPAYPAPSDIQTDLTVDNCGETIDEGRYYKISTPASVQVTTSDTGSKIPHTVKFDVKLGSQTRTYSYPYSASNTYEWNSINDFTYEGHTSYTFNNARVEFTDGSVSLPSPIISHSCPMMALD